MMKTLNWKFIFCVVLLLAILIWYMDVEIIYNVSYAEETYNNYGNNKQSEWNLRYDPALNPWGEFNQLLDLTLFAAWWAIIVASTFIK